MRVAVSTTTTRRPTIIRADDAATRRMEPRYWSINFRMVPLPRTTAPVSASSYTTESEYIDSSESIVAGVPVDSCRLASSATIRPATARMCASVGSAGCPEAACTARTTAARADARHLTSVSRSTRVGVMARRASPRLSRLRNRFACRAPAHHRVPDAVEQVDHEPDRQPHVEPDPRNVG
jgi:hypothetical protein